VALEIELAEEAPAEQRRRAPEALGHRRVRIAGHAGARRGFAGRGGIRDQSELHLGHAPKVVASRQSATVSVLDRLRGVAAWPAVHRGSRFRAPLVSFVASVAARDQRDFVAEQATTGALTDGRHRVWLHDLMGIGYAKAALFDADTGRQLAQIDTGYLGMELELRLARASTRPRPTCRAASAARARTW
jgi:hypothetical protein